MDPDLKHDPGMDTDFENSDTQEIDPRDNLQDMDLKDSNIEEIDSGDDLQDLKETGKLINYSYDESGLQPICAEHHGCRVNSYQNVYI